MKRYISLVLCLVMALTALVFVRAETAAADEVNGFVLKDSRRFEMVGADILLYEHVKTGAQVMFILNDDLNRTFEITFRTPCYTDKGIAHVFEHSVLDGSRKYPAKTLFFNLSYQTYNTYMNASTYNFMTTYPVASLSEEQLLLYADFYTDSVFHPMVLEDESIFREEAWRYSMADADSELTVAGTVYSEMLGAYTINRAASMNYDNEIFPGATCGRDSGGIPEVICTMTWDDLKQFHADYYHPSNTLTCLYGKIENVEAFLALLDGYFSEYEKKEFDIQELYYEPITAPVEKVYQYGLEAGADTADGAVVYYGFVCRDCDSEDALRLDFLTTLIADSSSVFQQRIKDELPSATAACYVNTNQPEVSVYFYATGVNEEDAPLFKQIVDESIQDVIENGFDPDAVDAIAAATVLDLLLANESSSIGTDLIPTIAYYWASLGDMYYYMDYVNKLDLFVDYATDGSLSEAAAKYLSGSELTALVTTIPVAGLKDDNDAAFAAHLAEIKAGMTEDEIAEIVATTNAADEAPEDSSAYVSALTAVTVDSLPEETREFDIYDETDENGIRYLVVDANTNGVGKTALLLDAQGLPQDKIHYFKLFVDLLGELDTASHTRQQLASLTTRYLYDGVIRVSVMSEDKAAHPYMRCTFTALDEDLKAGYDLVYELLFETDLTDVQAIANNVSNLKNSLKRTINNNSYSILYYRLSAYASPTGAYFNYASYLDYYDFLCAVEAQLESDPDSVVANLQAVQQYFHNRTNAVAGFVGNAESAAANTQAAREFLLRLDANEIEPQQYEFDKVEASEALIVDSAVMFNVYFASWEDLGLEGFDGAMDAITAYVSDKYLYPLLRDQYGAYGVIHQATDDGVYIISYRDPNVLETFAVYDSLPGLIAQDDPDQETLDGYILSSYSKYALSNGELTDGFSALLDYVSDDGSDALECMKQLKSVNGETFKAYASLYQALADNAVYGTAGSAAAINANSELYQNILNPFGVKDASDVTLADVTEDLWCYKQVRAVYENGYVFPDSETEFGVDGPATLGDLATAMYIAIGGDNSPEDAIAFLSQYQIIPNDAPDTVLTREDIAADCIMFYMATGNDVQPVDSIEAYADAAEVDADWAGYFGWAFDVEGLLLPDEGNTMNLGREATKGELCYTVFMMLIGE